MNKSDREALRLKLQRIERYPYFLYFPPGSGLLGKSMVLDLVINAQEREARVLELKKKYGNKFTRGIVSKGDEGEVVFTCAAPPLATFARDLKKLGKEVRELKEVAVTTAKEEERREREHAAAERTAEVLANDGSTTEAAEDRFSKLKDVNLRQPALDAVGLLKTLGNKAAAVEKAFQTTWRNGQKLKAYAKGAFQSLQDEKVSAHEKADTARFDQVRRTIAQLEGDWGTMSALIKEAKTTAGSAVSLTTQAIELRDTATSKKQVVAMIATAAKAAEAVRAAEVSVQRLSESQAAFQKAAETASRILVLPQDRLTATSEVADTLGLDGDNIVLPDAVRLHKAYVRMLADPLLPLLQAKVPLLPAVANVAWAPAGQKEKLTEQEFKGSLRQLVMLSSVSAAQIGTGLADATTWTKTKALFKKLQTGPMISSSAASNLLDGIHDWNSELQSRYFGSDQGQGLGRLNQQLAGFGLSPVDPQAFGVLMTLDPSVLTTAYGTISEEDGSRGAVSITATTRVAVAGGGPIGLMCAIEARLKGAPVTLYEGRPDAYSRGNVVTLYAETQARLRRYGVYDAIFGDGDSSAAQVKTIESALQKRAEDLGVTVVKGKGVAGIDKDPATGDLLLTVTGLKEPERAKLLIVAVGSGIARANKYANDVVLADQLGIKVEEFGLKDHALVGIFEEDRDTPRPKQERDLDTRAAWSVTLDTGKVKYHLAGMSDEEWLEVKDDKEALRALVEKRAASNPFMLVDVDLTQVGSFEIVVQRADKLVSKDKSAVLVGDSVATPHPQKGSGVNKGALGSEVVGDLVRNLVLAARKRTGRKEGQEEALDTYGERMEHIAEGATQMGIATMLGTRADRVATTLYQIEVLRGRNERGANGDKVSRPLVPRNTEVLKKLLAPGSKRGPLLVSMAETKLGKGKSGWKKAEAVGKRLDAMDKAARELLGIATEMLANDPASFEETVGLGLEHLHGLALG